MGFRELQNFATKCNVYSAYRSLITGHPSFFGHYRFHRTPPLSHEFSHKIVPVPSPDKGGGLASARACGRKNSCQILYDYAVTKD